MEPLASWFRIQQVQSDGVKTTLVYDALGQMVEQQNGGTYTQMLYSQVGKTAIMNGQTVSKAFIGLPGGGTAIYNSSGLSGYRHADWLGSSHVTTTTSRTVSSSSAYAPFDAATSKELLGILAPDKSACSSEPTSVSLNSMNEVNYE